MQTTCFICFNMSSTDPPAVEPAFLEIRQGQDRSITMSCRVLRAYPIRVLTYEWRLGNKLLRTGQFDSQEYTEYPVKSLSNENYGVYNCSIINEAGAGRCSFLVTGKILNISPCIYFWWRDLRLSQYKKVFCKSMEHTMSNVSTIVRAIHFFQRQIYFNSCSLCAYEIRSLCEFKIWWRGWLFWVFNKVTNLNQLF